MTPREQNRNRRTEVIRARLCESPSTVDECLGALVRAGEPRPEAATLREHFARYMPDVSRRRVVTATHRRGVDLYFLAGTTTEAIEARVAAMRAAAMRRPSHPFGGMRHPRTEARAEG